MARFASTGQYWAVLYHGHIPHNTHKPQYGSFWQYMSVLVSTGQSWIMGTQKHLTPNTSISVLARTAQYWNSERLVRTAISVLSSSRPVLASTGRQAHQGSNKRGGDASNYSVSASTGQYCGFTEIIRNVLLSTGQYRPVLTITGNYQQIGECSPTPLGSTDQY